MKELIINKIQYLMLVELSSKIINLKTARLNKTQRVH